MAQEYVRVWFFRDLANIYVWAILAIHAEHLTFSCGVLFFFFLGPSNGAATSRPSNRIARYPTRAINTFLSRSAIPFRPHRLHFCEYTSGWNWSGARTRTTTQIFPLRHVLRHLWHLNMPTTLVAPFLDSRGKLLIKTRPVDTSREFSMSNMLRCFRSVGKGTQERWLSIGRLV